jgi:hypothetical protein
VAKIVGLFCLATFIIGGLAGLHFGDHGEKEIAALKEGGLATMNELATAKAAQEGCQNKLKEKEAELTKAKAELDAAKATPKVATAGDTTPTNTTPATAPAPSGEPEEFPVGMLPDPTKCGIGAIYKIHRHDPGNPDTAYQVKVVACRTLDKNIRGADELKGLMKQLHVGGRSRETNICNGKFNRYDKGDPIIVCGKPDK